MKRVLTGIGFAAVFLFADAAKHDISNMVVEIKSPRKGIASDKLSSVPDPFIAAVEEVNTTSVAAPIKKEKDIRLGGIINKKAYINDSWHSKGDRVSGYTLEYVGTKGIVLVDGEQIRRIFLQKKKELLILTEKGM